MTNSKRTEALKLALEALEAKGDAWIVLERKAKAAIREALAEQPATVQQGGLEMVDDEGENQAVRMFLALYGGACGVTSEQMRKHLKMAGFDGAWPEWANSNNGHLTKAGAQLWIRHLFALEQPAQQGPVGCEGAIVNGHVYADRLEHDYKFECEAGPLHMCTDWVEFRRCFEWLAQHTSPPAQQEEPVAWMSDRAVGFKRSEFGATPTVPLYTYPPASKPLPDFLAYDGHETPQYIQGWNECRELMKDMK